MHLYGMYRRLLLYDAEVSVLLSPQRTRTHRKYGLNPTHKKKKRKTTLDV
jgi:hypothetical protein